MQSHFGEDLGPWLLVGAHAKLPCAATLEAEILSETLPAGQRPSELATSCQLTPADDRQTTHSLTTCYQCEVPVVK